MSGDLLAKAIGWLPHEYPFRFVDRIVHVEGGVTGVGIKNVTIDEPFFQGHFPGNPIMPGALIAEAMAQVSGIVMRAARDESAEVSSRKPISFLAGFREIKFRRLVVPGDVLVITSTVRRRRGRIWQFEVKAEVEGQTAAEGELTLADEAG